MIENIFNDYTFQVVLTGTIFLGILCGTLGSFIVLGKEALVGDCIAHSAYPGIVSAFLFMGVKNLFGQLVGAAITASMAMAFILWAKRKTSLPFDSILVTTLSGFFGIGIVLMTIVQKTNNANQAGLKHFIFGQASTMLERDLFLIAIAGSLIMLFILLFRNTLTVMTFDPLYTKTLTLPQKLVLNLLSFSTVLTVLLSIQTVGIILMSSFLIAPAVSARQWTRHLWSMVMLSSFFGSFSAAIGTTASTLISKMPTGPAIVVVMSIIVAISLLFAPKRGIVWRKK